jgi:tRNA(Ile)-lysidine synthase
MNKAFLNHIKTAFPMLFEKRIAVAISGGLDSVTLAHLLHQAGIKFQLIHVNFNLRAAESDADAHFVAQLAETFQCSLHLKSVNTQEYATDHQVSIQMAARELRYVYFKELVSDDVIDYVLTAHHLDDQLETLLINLGRGTGLRGLTGIPATSGSILRPLLSFSRDEILEYALSRKLTWREDSSNTSNKYVRNDLRNNIIPLLKQSLPHLLQTLPDTLEHLKESVVLLDHQVDAFYKKAVETRNDITRISIQGLEETGHPRAYLYEILKDKGFHTDDALQLLQASSGKLIYGEQHRLVKDREFLYLTDLKSKPKVQISIDQLIPQMEIGGKLLNMELITTSDPLKTLKAEVDKMTLLLDADGVEFPLEVRNWQEGDIMMPLGLQGKKKISDILIDHKISVLKKEKCLVLKDKQDLLWLVGLRTSEKHKITTSTQRILKICFTD